MTAAPATQPLLEVRDLEVRYGGRARLRTGTAPPGGVTAVDGVSLELHTAEILGLVGESGCGKSSLARVLVGAAKATGGHLRLRGDPIGAKRPRAVRRQIQMVFQDPNSSLNPRYTVRQTLTELLRVHRLRPRREIEARCHELVVDVGLDPTLLDRRPGALSGGQRQRVAIARALAVEPDVLVADEAVSALDVSVQAGILHLLVRLRRQLGLAVLFISHDLAVVRNVCDSVLVMHRGQIVEHGSADALFNAPQHPHTRALLAAVSAATPGARRAGGLNSGDKGET